MSGKELVMAIVCCALSSREILQTEKENNVVIFRKIIYDKQAGFGLLSTYFKKIGTPLKCLFIFGMGDSMLINCAEDLEAALNRLVSIWKFDKADYLKIVYYPYGVTAYPDGL